ncbi:MAG: hypothetical protein K8W52_30510 [Deltaproteobacteria bacterium]|nr:hypothetical protein [Deltaproteobacteria bacterium]
MTLACASALVLAAACGGGGSAAADADLGTVACTTTPLASLPGRHQGGLGLSANAHGAAIVWRDQLNPISGATTTHVQQLTLAGAPIGPETTSVAVVAASAVAVDADGVVWCDERAGQTLQCTKLGAAPAALVDFGSRPQLAFGIGAMLLADVAAINIDGEVRVRPLDASALGGTPTTIASFGALSPVVRLAATATGYVLATGTDRGPLTVTRLDDSGHVVGAPIVTRAMWHGTDLAIAAAGDDVILVWPDLLQRQIIAQTVRGSGAVSEPVDTGAAIDSSRVGAAASPGGFAVTWADFAGHIALRLFSVDGAPRGTPQPLVPTAWAGNEQALVAVPDGFLLATAMDPVADEIQLAHVACTAAP